MSELYADDVFFFKAPFTGILAGPTMCGKSVWTLKLVEAMQTLIRPTPERVIWCRGIKTDNKLPPHITVIEGLPENFESIPHNSLLILDDLQEECSKSSEVSNLYVRYAHHRRISVLSLQQNLFASKSRTQRVNSTYIIFMRNPSDKKQISTLSQQVFPQHRNFLTNVMDDACKEPFQYFVLDLHATTSEHLRVVTRIFDDDGPSIYYLP